MPTRWSGPVARSSASESPFVQPAEGTLFHCASQPCGGVDHLRPLVGRQEASPLRAAGARERQALVPLLGLELMQAGVPVADVPVRVGRHDVLVPGDGVHRLVDVSDVLGLVQLVDADDRLELAVPDRVAARQRDSLAGVLDRSMDGAADPLGGRPRGRRVAFAAALDQVGERAGQVGGRRLPGEDLVAAVHRAVLALEAIGLGAGHLLDIEVVLVREPGREAPGDVAVVADADQGHPGGAYAVDLGQVGGVELELDEELRHGEAELRAVVEVCLAVVGVLHRPHERSAGAGEDAAKPRAWLVGRALRCCRRAGSPARCRRRSRDPAWRGTSATSGSPCARRPWCGRAGPGTCPPRSGRSAAGPWCGQGGAA